MRTVKAAAVQLSPVLYSREGTVDKVVRTIHELGRAGVQFATFPETVVPYYPYFSFVQPAYQIIGGGEHLKLLEGSGLVRSRKAGRIRTYELAPEHMKVAEDWLGRQRKLWERRFDQLDSYLMNLKEEESK